MVYSNEAVITTLNKLIALGFDAYEGFRLAAQGAEDPRLRSLLLGYGDQRALFAEELQAQVRRLGGEAASGGSLAGSLHRGWLDVRMALAGKDDITMTAECERGERALLSEYHAAKLSELPPSARQLMVRQAEFIEATRERLHVMAQVEQVHSE